MSSTVSQGDLMVLVADLDAELAMRALLRRTQSLGIRTVSFQVDRFPRHDAGCCREADVYLRPFIRQFEYAMVLFDRHGSGRESLARQDLEAHVEERLTRNGWANRCAVIVLDPELEAWVWARSGEVASVLGWAGRQPDLYAWLAQNCPLRNDDRKPLDPKTALHKALRIAGKRPSAAIIRQLAERVGLGHCIDDAFGKLRSTL